MKYFSIFILLIGFFTAKTSYAALVDGLVTYYSFDGNANDLSGNGNDGVVYGATLTTDRFGVANRAYDFDGINDYILASADPLPTADRTVALWFKADSLINNPMLMGYGGGTCGTSWYMGLNASNDGSYHLSSHCNANTLTSAYSQPPINKWIHFAASTDANGTRLYVNGVEVASNNNYITNTSVLGRDLSIGVATSPSGFAPYTDINIGFFDGALDDVRVYNRALSLSEIQQLAAVPLAPAVYYFGIGILFLIGAIRKTPIIKTNN